MGMSILRDIDLTAVRGHAVFEAGGWFSCRACSASPSFLQQALGVVADRDIRIPTSVMGVLTAQSVDQPEEDGQVRVPSQQPIDHLAAGCDDLAGQQHEGI